MGNRHHGDKEYRKLCISFLSEVLKKGIVPTKARKDALSRIVVHEIHHCRGGRFLERVTYGTLLGERVPFDEPIDDPTLVHGWREKTADKAILKVKQYLREKLLRWDPEQSPLLNDNVSDDVASDDVESDEVESDDVEFPDVESYFKSKLFPTPPERLLLRCLLICLGKGQKKVREQLKKHPQPMKGREQLKKHPQPMNDCIVNMVYTPHPCSVSNEMYSSLLHPKDCYTTHLR